MNTTEKLRNEIIEMQDQINDPYLSKKIRYSLNKALVNAKKLLENAEHGSILNDKYKDKGHNIVVFGYETQNFGDCPMATETFEKLVAEADNSTYQNKKEEIRLCAEMVDKFLGIENRFRSGDDRPNEEDIKTAFNHILLAQAFYTQAHQQGVLSFLEEYLTNLYSGYFCDEVEPSANIEPEPTEKLDFRNQKKEWKFKIIDPTGQPFEGSVEMDWFSTEDDAKEKIKSVYNLKSDEQMIYITSIPISEPELFIEEQFVPEPEPITASKKEVELTPEQEELVSKIYDYIVKISIKSKQMPNVEMLYGDGSRWQHKKKLFYFLYDWIKKESKSFEKGGELSTMKEEIKNMPTWELENKLRILQEEKREGNFDDHSEKILILIMEEINKRQGNDLKEILQNEEKHNKIRPDALAILEEQNKDSGWTLQSHVGIEAANDPNFFRWLFNEDFAEDFDNSLTDEQQREWKEFFDRLPHNMKKGGKIKPILYSTSNEINPLVAHHSKFKKVMAEWKAGTLRTKSGKKVTDQKQAEAIAFSEVRSAVNQKEREEHIQQLKRDIELLKTRLMITAPLIYEGKALTPAQAKKKIIILNDQLKNSEIHKMKRGGHIGFQKLEKEIEKEYLKKGKSKARAKDIGMRTAGKIKAVLAKKNRRKSKKSGK